MFDLIKPLLRDPRLNARLLVSTLVIQALGLASAFYSMLVFSRYMSHGLDSTLLTLTIGAVLAMALEMVLRRMRFRIMGALCAQRERMLFESTLQRLLKAPVSALQGLGSIDRAAPTRAIEQVSTVMSPANVLAIIDAPFALLFIAVLFTFAWQIGLLALVFAMAVVVGIYFHSFGMRGATLELQNAQSQHAAFMSAAERLDTVRLTNAHELMTGRGGYFGGISRLHRYEVGVRQEHMQNFMQNASVLLSIIIIGLGAKLVMLNLIDYGGLLGASLLATRMLSLITRPAHSAALLLEGAQALATVERYLTLPIETSEGTQLARYSGRLEFKDVAFGFTEGAGPLFENLSLQIESGSLVVVVGGNGAGKTTMTRLVAGLLEPTRGQLLADGVDIRQLHPAWWRKQLVFLPQEPELLDGTLHENLLMLAPNGPEEWVRHILQIVGLKEFVDHHPLGIKMPITQGGRMLSLGIRRRIALARALVSEGQLVVMDEPAEGLDSAGVAMINGLLSELLRQGRTLLIMMQSPGDLARHALVIDLDVKPSPRVLMPEMVVEANE